MFEGTYSAINAHYSERRDALRHDPDCYSILTQGYIVHDDWYPPTIIAEMRDNVPDLARLAPTLQTPAIHISDPSLSLAPFDPFFRDERIWRIAKAIVGPECTAVRRWAQIRVGKGHTGSFDEFFHIDSFKHRLKAFLYLTDVDAEGSVVICPGMSQGAWHHRLASQLAAVEGDSSAQWESESESYEAISASRVNHFAGTLTPFDSQVLLEACDVKPVPLSGRAGTLVIFDSRTLHKHEVATSGSRVMLEAVFANGKDFG